MLAINNGLQLLLLAEAGESGGIYNEYFNIPGFELWKFINLVIFVAVLVYLLKKPLSETFKAKRDAIRAELIKAEEERQAAQARLVAAEAKLAQLESEKAAILTNAKAEAEADRTRLLEETEAEIRRLRAQADAEIARIAQISKAGIKRLAAEESIRLAEEKLRSRMDVESDSRLVKASIQEIGGLK
jgi:F-type H+-transporting ATPase subunit b